MRTEARGEELRALTGLRFLLALWVLALHLIDLDPAYQAMAGRLPLLVRMWLTSGASAVGIFFMLSGFVLTYSYRPERVATRAGIWGFWRARFARIYPVYVFSLLVTAVVLLLPYAHGVRRFSDVHGARVAAVVVENLTLTQALFPGEAMAWSGAGWPLSVEVVFYVCFPLLVPVVWKARGTRGLLLGVGGCWLAALLATVAAGFGLRHLGGANAAQVRVDFELLHPLVRVPEFVAGMLVAVMYKRLKEAGAGVAGGVISGGGMAGGVTSGLVGLFPVVVAVVALRISPGLLHNGVLLPYSAALMMALAFGRGRVAAMLASRVMNLLGKASFSLYLLHVPLFFWIQGMLNVAGLRKVTLWRTPLYVVLVTACSVATFWWVEEPMKRWIVGARRVEDRTGEMAAAADPL